jgi:hypothetical protein
MQNDYTANYVDKASVEFSRYLSMINGEKIQDLSVQGCKKRRIGLTEVGA